MKLRSLLVSILFIAALGFVVFKLIFTKSGAISGLKIVTIPTSSVYLDDKFVGKTPYDGQHPAGTYALKLVPEDSARSSWQDKVVLTSQTLTYVKKELGESELTTGGEVVSLEKIANDEIQLAITSTPDASVVAINGMDKGITPLNLTIMEGEHGLVVNSTGFVGRSIKIKAVKGFRVNVNFQLALSSQQLSVSPTPGEGSPTPTISGSTATSETAKEPPKPYVLVKNTPTNFLRVRFDASLSASEVARLAPGDKVPFLEEKSGWFKVIYEADKEGWISSRYAEKVE